MSEWTSTDLPPDHCPVCGYRIEAASAPQQASPSPGDLAVCMACASVSRFDNRLRLHEMTQRDIFDLHPDNRDEILLVQRGIRMLDRRRTHLR
jgi:hypothetical protein